MWLPPTILDVPSRRTSRARSRSRPLLEELEPRIAPAGDPGPFGHDPSVIQEGSYYYLFSTGGDITIQRSTDLVNWQPDGSVFASVPAWAQAAVPGATDLWAPDISYFDGLYHLYYAVSTFGSNNSAIGMATNVTLDPTSADYKWVDHGMVIRSYAGQSDFNAIDPNAVFDAAGNLWLDFGSFFSGIKLIELDPTTGLPATPNPPMTSLATQPGPDAIEGPFIIHQDNYYYLFASIGFC